MKSILAFLLFATPSAFAGTAIEVQPQDFVVLARAFTSVIPATNFSIQQCVILAGAANNNDIECDMKSTGDFVGTVRFDQTKIDDGQRVLAARLKSIIRSN